jgi:hypothetical protein
MEVIVAFFIYSQGIPLELMREAKVAGFCGGVRHMDMLFKRVT